MTRIDRFVMAAAALLAITPLAGAQSMHTRELVAETRSTPIVTRGEGVVTQLDFDVYMARLPEHRRAAYVSDPDRIAKALNALMVPRQLANRAQKTYPDAMSEPLFQARMQQALLVLMAERFMEKAWSEKKLDSYEAQARELFMVRKDLFDKPVHADFTHLLVRAGNVRPELDAMRSIINVYELLAEDKTLAELAGQYSEDPNARDNDGRYESASLQELDPAVSEVVRKLEPGQVSQPFRSAIGWHIVELHDRFRPELGSFEEVRERAVEIARQRHRNQVRERILQEVNQVPVAFEPGAIDGLLERYEPTESDLDKLRSDLRALMGQNPADSGGD